MKGEIMSKKKFFTIKTLLSFLISLFLLSISCIVIAGPDLEKDIKNDLSVYINYLNDGKISEYYNMYNTRKLTDIEKSLFYEKIKNVDILRKINNNIYLCNLSVDYQIREGVDTTKTIKKSDDFILKILYTGKDGYKILLPFNSMDKDFSESEVFTYLEQLYKVKKAKEIEEKRLIEEEKEKQEEINKEEDADKIYEDENGLEYNKDESEDFDETNSNESQDSSNNEINSNQSQDVSDNKNKEEISISED